MVCDSEVGGGGGVGWTGRDGCCSASADSLITSYTVRSAAAASRLYYGMLYIDPGAVRPGGGGSRPHPEQSAELMWRSHLWLSR